MTTARAQSGAPVITASPANATISIGFVATFSVNATGSATLGYQWQMQPFGGGDWTNVTNNGTVAGSAGSTLSISGVTSAMSGDSFRCAVSNDAQTSTSSPAVLQVIPYAWSILAGASGNSGSTDANGPNARFYGPSGIALDSHGDVFVADRNNYTIRKIDPNGNVTTFAGLAGNSSYADGVGGNARFGYPSGLAIDSGGNIFVADAGNNLIRKITPDGNVTTYAGNYAAGGYADGPAGSAEFNYPTAVAVDNEGNVYVADDGNNLIRKITPGGMVSTLAGQAGVAGSRDGPGPDAQFNQPLGIAVDAAGNVYVADAGNNAIRKITATGFVSTLAGWMQGFQDGAGRSAWFFYPSGVAVDADGHLYVADPDNNAVRVITPSGVVTTLPGSVPDNALNGIAVDGAGTLYVCDYDNNVVRKAVPTLSPIVQSQPQSLSLGCGLNGTFNVSAVGTGTLNFQWQVSTDGGSTWGNLADDAVYAGSQTPALTASNVTPSLDLNEYRCAVNSALGAQTSSAAVLTVEQTAAPVFSPNGGGIGENSSENVSLSCPTPGATIYYSINNNSTINTPYTGAISLGFYSNVGVYNLSAQAFAPGLSPSAVTQVAFNAVLPPTIDFEPASSAVPQGSSVSLSVGITTNTVHPVYQWYGGASGDTSNPIPGATGNTYQTPTLTQNASYWVQVGNGVNSANSTTAALTVGPQVATPILSPNGGAFAANTTQSVSLSCTTPGASIFCKLGTSSQYSAYTGAFNITSNNSVQAYATATNHVQSAGASANFFFYTTAPKILGNSTLQSTVNYGYSASFNVFASNASLYQWYQGASGNTSTLLLSSTSQGSLITPPVLGTTSYWVLVSNPIGNVASPTFTASAYSAPVVAWGLNTFLGSPCGQCTVPANLSNVAGLAATFNVSFALKGDGTVVAWGHPLSNGYNQTQIPADLSGVVAIAANGYHCLALKSDGTVVGWGSNYYGEASPPAGLDKVAAIAAGEWFNLALEANGTVAAWGNNTAGQCNVPANLSGVVAVAAGRNHALALKNDGTVVAWGDNSFGQCSVPGNLTNVIAIAAGANHSLALKRDGSVVAWGSNVDDNNDTLNQAVVPAGLSGVKAIAAEECQSLALKSDGTVVSWGGFPDSINSVPAGLSTLSFSMIAAGGSHFLALLSSATLAPQPTPPDDQIIESGETATLVAKAPGGTSFQWYQGATGDTSQPVSGATLPWLTTPALTQSTYYWVQVGNAAGTTDSSSVTAVVAPPTYPEWAAANGLSGDAALPESHAMSDALPNLFNYAMNLDASPPADELPLISYQTSNGVTYLTLQFRQRKGMTGMQLIPETSTDLVNWSAISSSYITLLTDDDVNTQRLEVAVPMPANGGLFLRLDAIFN